MCCGLAAAAVAPSSARRDGASAIGQRPVLIRVRGAARQLAPRISTTRSRRLPGAAAFRLGPAPGRPVRVRRGRPPGAPAVGRVPRLVRRREGVYAMLDGLLGQVGRLQAVVSIGVPAAAPAPLVFLEVLAQLLEGAIFGVCSSDAGGLSCRRGGSSGAVNAARRRDGVAGGRVSVPSPKRREAEAVHLERLGGILLLKRMQVRLRGGSSRLLRRRVAERRGALRPQTKPPRPPPPRRSPEGTRPIRSGSEMSSRFRRRWTLCFPACCSISAARPAAVTLSLFSLFSCCWRLQKLHTQPWGGYMHDETCRVVAQYRHSQSGSKFCNPGSIRNCVIGVYRARRSPCFKSGEGFN